MATLCPVCKKAIPDLEIDMHIMERHPANEEPEMCKQCGTSEATIPVYDGSGFLCENCAAPRRDGWED